MSARVEAYPVCPCCAEPLPSHAPGCGTQVPDEEPCDWDAEWEHRQAHSAGAR